MEDPNLDGTAEADGNVLIQLIKKISSEILLYGLAAVIVLGGLRGLGDVEWEIVIGAEVILLAALTAWVYFTVRDQRASQPRPVAGGASVHVRAKRDIVGAGGAKIAVIEGSSTGSKVVDVEAGRDARVGEEGELGVISGGSEGTQPVAEPQPPIPADVSGTPSSPTAMSGVCTFIGRDNIMSVLEALGSSPAANRRHHTGGPWGIGKTALLEELERRMKRSSKVLLVKAGTYVPRCAPTGSINPPSPYELTKNWERYIDLLKDLAQAGETERFDALSGVVTAVRDDFKGYEINNYSVLVEAGRDIKVGAQGKIGIEIAGQAPSVPSAASVFGQLTNMSAILTDKFVSYLDEIAGHKVDEVAGRTGVLLLVDELDRLDGYPIGDWVLRLVTTLRRTAVVVATTVPISSLVNWGEDLRRCVLTPFSRDEVRACLISRVGPDTVTDSLVDRVLSFSGGLPHAVGLAGDVLAARADKKLPETLDELLGMGVLSAQHMVDVLLHEISDPDLKILLRKGSLARRLDEGVVRLLVTAESGKELTDDRAAQLLGQLTTYSFIEECDRLNADGLGRFRFRDYFQRAALPHDRVAADKLLQINSQGVHRELAAHYRKRRNELEEIEIDNQTPFLQWYRYEQREWQTLTAEWLYHSAQLSNTEHRMEAGLELCCCFLDAFWWWGCYVPFPFCQELLDQWDRTQPTEDHSWSACLRVLLDRYPLGHEKTGYDEDWAEVQAAMTLLRQKAGCAGTSVQLEDPPEEKAPDVLWSAKTRRRLRAFTGIFLAHSCRFRLRSSAQMHYNDALRWLELDKDMVAVAWTKFELAELFSELGMRDESGTCCAEAMRLAIEYDEGDHELAANLHRLRADLAFAAGQVDQAVAAMAEAVRRAFTQLRNPTPPDPYTVVFYQELRQRSTELLLDIQDRSGDDTAQHAAARLHRELAVLWLNLPDGPPSAEALSAALDPGDWAAITACLTPPPPALPAAAHITSGFCKRATLVIQQIEDNFSAADQALGASA